MHVVEEPKPGKALDELIAKHVMGLSRRGPRSWLDGSHTGWGWRDDKTLAFIEDDSLPGYSTDDSAALQVVRKLLHPDKVFILEF